MNEYIAEEFKGYSTFIEIKSPLLRAYNQYTTLTNMKENKLFQLMEDYLEKIGAEARLGLLIISEYIKAKGLEETKRELIVNGSLVLG